MNAAFCASLAYTIGMRTRTDPFNPPKPPRSFSLGATDKRLAVLDLFTRYDCLPGAYIRRAARVSTWTLTQLNRGWYIRAIPFSTNPSLLDARNREPVWQIAHRGKIMLGKAVMAIREHMKHKVGRNLCQFSFDIAPEDIPGLSLKTPADLLAHPLCPPATRTMQFPFAFETDQGVIIPDSDVFGYEMNGRYFYLLFEFDNGTETRVPGTEKARKKKNITKMVRQYAKARALIKARFGITNIFIAIIADDARHMQSIKRTIEAEVSPEDWRYFGLQCFPEPVKGQNFPPPTGWLVTDDWTLAGDGRLNILEVLSGPTRKGATGGRAIGADTEA